MRIEARTGLCAFVSMGVLAIACGGDEDSSVDTGEGGAGGVLSNGATAGALGAGALPSSGGISGLGGAESGGNGVGGSAGALASGTGNTPGVDAGNVVGDAGIPIDTVLIENPWCVAPSHSSTYSLGTWAPRLAAAGMGWVRNFTDMEGSLTIAADNGMSLSGLFALGSAFPVQDLAGWGTYVTGRMTESAGRVRYWEVWNEPPNFSDDKSPASYAAIVKAAYDAAKAADPNVQVGLAAASVHLNFLDQAFDAGVAGHFDYVTLHPYETLGLVAQGFEAQFMSIVPTARKMLAARDPERADVPVWFTELGEPVGGDVTEEHQADTLVKAYVMSLAQGVARVCWFEALDGDSGPFGLIDADDNERPAYTALSTLVSHLGRSPRYVGWLLLSGQHYAFVFAGLTEDYVMVTWAPPGVTDTLALDAPALIVDPRTGASTVGDSLELDAGPRIVVGVPLESVVLARANRDAPFPWRGDFTGVTAVSYAAPDTEAGLHPLGAAGILIVEGSPARDASGSAAQNFTVDPNFVSYDAPALRVTAVVRRNGADSAGFNLKYEAADGWKGTGSWYTVPEGTAWSIQTWDITDAQFVGKWGYNFSFDSDSTTYSKYSIQSVTVEKL